MDKRYQVFVSSTYEDLREERQEVIQALLELDCIPAGMELFSAADEDQWTLIRKVIDDCDYYILIIAGRYGSCGPGGKSYTQMEYEYAVEQGKPVIAFLHKNPGKIASDRTEQSAGGKAALELFRKLAQKKMCKFWTSRKDLGGIVSRSLINQIKTRPGVGWVRADLVPSESSAQVTLQLKREVEELRAKLEVSRLMAPKGAENLSQGDETIQPAIRIAVKTSEFALSEDEYYEAVVALSWNEIMSCLGPLMIDRASESDLSRAVVKYFRDRWGESLFKDRSWKIGFSKLRDGLLATILVQFRALGLVSISGVRARSTSDKETYWSLTPYGENRLSNLKAIPAGPPAKEAKSVKKASLTVLSQHPF